MTIPSLVAAASTVATSRAKNVAVYLRQK